MRRGRDVELALLVAADDGRVLQVNEVVVIKLNELGPDLLGCGFVGVADDNQSAHLSLLLTDALSTIRTPRCGG